jgi:uncharacterized protein YpmB
MFIVILIIIIIIIIIMVLFYTSSVTTCKSISSPANWISRREEDGPESATSSTINHSAAR